MLLGPHAQSVLLHALHLIELVLPGTAASSCMHVLALSEHESSLLFKLKMHGIEWQRIWNFVMLAVAADCNTSIEASLFGRSVPFKRESLSLLLGQEDRLGSSFLCLLALPQDLLECHGRRLARPGCVIVSVCRRRCFLFFSVLPLRPLSACVLLRTLVVWAAPRALAPTLGGCGPTAVCPVGAPFSVGVVVVRAPVVRLSPAPV